MDVDIFRSMSVETPASEMSEYVVEHVTALMTLGGIESISSVKYQCGFGSRLHVSIATFADAPSEVTSQGVVIKDALAQIMSVANISRIVMKPSGDDIAGMKSTWDEAVRAARAANGGAGSGQDFGSGTRDDASAEVEA